MNWNDTLNEDMNEMSHINYGKYLGQVISSDSKNTHNIEQLRNKGIGIKNNIIEMLERMPGGQFHFHFQFHFEKFLVDIKYTIKF